MTITQTFERLRRGERKALIPFAMGGYPTMEGFATTLRELLAVGDIVEVGIPFSDPVADGPTIQAAATKALAAGATIDGILGVIRDELSSFPRRRESSSSTNLDTGVRRYDGEDSPPVVVMVSITQALAHGVEQFVAKAKASGVSGLIVPDLPAEESGEVRVVCKRNNIDLIPLVAPTTDSKRRQRIVEQAEGFVYAVAVKGVTGAREGYDAETIEYVKSLREQTDKPVCVGFGISGPAQIEQLYDSADGFIVASALIRAMERGEPIGPLLEALKRACSGQTSGRI
ncbi:MAG: tryptophan synthase subunit alpha [Planctomycetes bacterium]|nr:tryptophan synthase subunit alpha [Planctomycetota bacterium]